MKGRKGYDTFGYINTGRVNIRIHRDTCKMWFGVEKEKGHGNLITNTPDKFWSQNDHNFQDFIINHLSKVLV